ncbi:MAG: DUF975 family protein [Clostridiales bacterium]
MGFQRSELKQSAKEQLAGKWGTVIGCYLIFICFTAVLNFVLLFFTDYSVDMKPLLAALVDFATITVTLLVTAPLTLGWIYLILKIVRGKLVSVSTIFEGFKRFLPAFLVMFLMQVFISLWALLLIVPAIIKSFSYAMAIYILADDEDISPLDAITKSRKMMVGHKWEYFVLQLSFVFWFLLVCVTFGLASLYVGPYMEVTMGNFYQRLKAENAVEKVTNDACCEEN